MPIIPGLRLSFACSVEAAADGRAGIGAGAAAALINQFVLEPDSLAGELYNGMNISKEAMRRMVEKDR
ncbi:MAG: hypothetical protein ABSH56_11740 [Bryobacteraceae bacterium]|jgi:hypothetical protein